MANSSKTATNVSSYIMALISYWTTLGLGLVLVLCSLVAYWQLVQARKATSFRRQNCELVEHSLSWVSWVTKSSSQSSCTSSSQHHHHHHNPLHRTPNLPLFSFHLVGRYCSLYCVFIDDIDRSIDRTNRSPSGTWSNRYRLVSCVALGKLSCCVASLAKHCSFDLLFLLMKSTNQWKCQIITKKLLTTEHPKNNVHTLLQ